MRTKLLCTAAALVVSGGALLASAGPASAQYWRHHYGWGPGAVAGGIIGGAVAAATSPLWAPGYYGYGPDYAYDYDYGPDYAYGYGPAYGPPVATGSTIVEQRSAAVEEPMGNSVAYCEAHFKSYNPATGTYLGYDGVRHSCP